MCYKTFLSLSPHAHFAGPRKFLMPFSGGGPLTNYITIVHISFMMSCSPAAAGNTASSLLSLPLAATVKTVRIGSFITMIIVIIVDVMMHVMVPKTSPPKAVKLRKTFTSLRLVGETWNCHAPPASSSSTFGDSERGDAAVPWMDRKMLVLETKEINLIKLLRLFSPFARNLAPEHNSLIAVNPVPKIYNQSKWGQFGLEIKPEIDTLG